MSSKKTPAKHHHLSSLFDFLYVGLFLVLIAGQLLRLQLTPSIAIYPHDLLVLIINSFWLITSTRSFTHSRLPRLIYWIPTFGLVAFMSLFVNFSRLNFSAPLTTLSGFLYLVRWLNFGLLLPATYHLISTNRLHLKLNSWLLTWAIAVAVLGLVQYIILPDTRFLYSYGWDDHLNRLISTLFDPAFTGLLLILGLILEDLAKKPRPLITALFTVSILLTYSRASYLTLLIIFFLIAWRSHSLRYFISRFTLFVLIFFMLPHTEGEGVNLSRTYSIASRVESSETALHQASRVSLIGIGFNNYRLLETSPSKYPNHVSSPDNSFLLLLVTTGLIGTGVYLYFWSQAIFWSYHHSSIIFVTLIAISLHSFTNNSLFYPFVMVWWWILLAAELSSASAKSTYRS